MGRAVRRSAGQLRRRLTRARCLQGSCQRDPVPAGRQPTWPCPHSAATPPRATSSASLRILRAWSASGPMRRRASRYVSRASASCWLPAVTPAASPAVIASRSWTAPASRAGRDASYALAASAVTGYAASCGTCTWSRSTNVARPSAAPHMAFRSWFEAAVARSAPAAWISRSPLARITTASTT